MSIVANGKESIIIDRTLMNITRQCFNEEYLLQFIKNLKRVGVDFFEIDERTFYLLEPLIKSEALIFKIDNIDQLEICKLNKIENILIQEENLEFINNQNVGKNYKIILEIQINHCKDNIIEKINKNIDANRFSYIRFKGLCNWNFKSYMLENNEVKTNIYASDKYSMATAVGFQAILKGFDSITTAFCGKDEEEDTTALEEILVSTKVIMGGEPKGELCLLAEMREQYEKITCRKVPNNKSIIGKDIFKYESGVHVAGIERNPITYEPYKPELVGMNRKLALGKHSGKNSINYKLKELGIDNKFNVGEIINILNQVKNKSILDKMEISDKDFVDICRGMEELQNV